MFQGLACHFELIFGLLIIPECDLAEVEKVMFQRLECHFHFIIGLWTSTKCDLGEIINGTFLVVARH